MNYDSIRTLARGAALTLAITASPAIFGANAVVQWNDTATQATGAALDPLRETRVLAITHIAIHDALNAIERKYAPYAWDRQVGAASADAAVAAAARDALVALVPSQAGQIEAAYRQAIDAIPAGAAKESGIKAGQRSAAVILAERAGDGSDRNGSARVGTQPGEYRPTPPDFIPGFLPDWGRVQPFAMRNASQFRPEAPYRLRSDEYTLDYVEVAAVGEKNSSRRTEETSEIAMYWYENSGLGWNRIGRVAAEARQLGNWEAARLFALLNIAMADGFIGGFEAKYHFNFWRPVTAIVEGDVDGNDDTRGQYHWTPFLPTPPVPDYPSTHSVLGAAAARVLGRFFGTDFMSFEMTSGAPYAGITRKFWSFSQAAAENAASRVLAGIHFASACRAGLWQGERIGEFTFHTVLRPAGR